MKVLIISAMWCPSCLIMRPRYLEISKKYNLIIEEYDYDYDEEISKKYSIGKILPVCIVMKNDVEVKRIIGEKSKKELEQLMGDISNEN